MAQLVLAPFPAMDRATDPPERIGDPSVDSPPASGGDRFHTRVCVPGHQSSISPVVQSLMDVVRETQCATGKEFEIETALREALANAVVHGCRNDPSHVVECAFSCSESCELTIVVRDPGPGFDPASVPSPLTADNVYSTHGRGIYLIRQFMDEVWFERGGSEIHMVLKQTNVHAGGKRS